MGPFENFVNTGVTLLGHESCEQSVTSSETVLHSLGHAFEPGSCKAACLSAGCAKRVFCLFGGKA